MQRVFMYRYCLCAAFVVSVGTTSIYGQMPSMGMSQSMPGNSQMGTGTPGIGQNNSGGYQNPDDALTAVAPPFDVEDVLRMHRVGLQDDVITNALRTRYQPLILKDAERSALKAGGVSERVIVAIEDPYGIGIQNVRANIATANSEAPPLAQTAQQARDADPKTPKLIKRSESSESGDVYVGQSHPQSSMDTGSDRDKPNDNNGNADVAAGSTSSLALNAAPATHIPPEPTTRIVSRPIGPGVYLRHGSEWERVGGEPIYWNHPHGDKSIEGSILRPSSSTQTYPGGTDFLVITADGTSAIQYQLVRLHSNDVRRTFTPASAGGVYTAAGAGDLMRFDPQRLGSSSWLISLHDVPIGEYGLLPPVTTKVHSTTNLSTMLYTFRIK